MLTILNGGSGASSCKINGLQKFTTYEFFIVPFYKAVEGKPSNSRTAQTLEDGKFTLIMPFAFSFFFLQPFHNFQFYLNSSKRSSIQHGSQIIKHINGLREMEESICQEP